LSRLPSCCEEYRMPELSGSHAAPRSGPWFIVSRAEARRRMGRRWPAGWC
jgi:hypothetical protein